MRPGVTVSIIPHEYPRIIRELFLENTSNNKQESSEEKQKKTLAFIKYCLRNMRQTAYAWCGFEGGKRLKSTEVAGKVLLLATHKFNLDARRNVYAREPR